MSGFVILNNQMFDHSSSQSKQRKIEIINKIFFLSEKIRNHVLSCGYKNDCKICPKIDCWVNIFLKYEKDNNKKAKIEQIIDEEFVDKVFFEDDLMIVI